MPKRWSNYTFPNKTKLPTAPVKYAMGRKSRAVGKKFTGESEKHSGEGLKRRGFWTIGSWKKGEIEIVLLRWCLIGSHAHITVGGWASWPAGWSQLKYLQYVQSSKEWNDCQQHFSHFFCLFFWKKVKFDWTVNEFMFYLEQKKRRDDVTRLTIGLMCPYNLMRDVCVCVFFLVWQQWASVVFQPQLRADITRFLLKLPGWISGQTHAACSEASSPTDGATGLRDHVTQMVIQVCKSQAHCLTASFAFHAAAVDFH